MNEDLQMKDEEKITSSESKDWLDTAIFYEIYPQSFSDSNGDGIGDFDGIINKLDYIRNLGCNAIWINPCFESPFKDAGYDISDYYKTAPRYGSNSDLVRLFEQAHSRGMHVILDLVPGHTSIQHPWFKKSMEAEENEFTNRYVWTDSVWEEPVGMSSIKGISDRDGVCAVNFFSHQPALNYGFAKIDRPWQQSPNAPGPQATLKEMLKVMSFWLEAGADGFRVDMAGSLVKNDPDSKGTIALWNKVRKFLDENFPDARLISEWGDPEKSLAGGFHMDFLLHFGPSHYNDLFRCDKPFFSSKGNGNCYDFVKKYIQNYEKANGSGLICIPSGNHDMDRLARYIHDDELKIAFAFLLSMPGCPFIYYGDEIGMNYVEGLVSVEGGYGRTGSRSPMQWDNSKNAGFSSAEKENLYIQQDPSPDRPTVQAQAENPDSLYNEVKKIIGIRRNTKTLQNKSKITFLFAVKNKYPLAYIRGSGKDSVVVLINPSQESASFPCKIKLGQALYQFGGKVIQGGNMISVPGKTAAFFTVEEKK